MTLFDLTDNVLPALETVKFPVTLVPYSFVTQTSPVPQDKEDGIVSLITQLL